MKNVKRAFTLVEIMIVVLIIGILLAIAVPNFIRAREQSRAKSCSANLKQIDSAKEQWAMDNKAASGTAVTGGMASLIGANGYIKSEPSCPSTPRGNVRLPAKFEISRITTNPRANTMFCLTTR